MMTGKSCLGSFFGETMSKIAKNHKDIKRTNVEFFSQIDENYEFYKHNYKSYNEYTNTNWPKCTKRNKITNAAKLQMQQNYKYNKIADAKNHKEVKIS